MGDAPYLTVAICTHNRHALLRETLARLTELRVPRDLRWELLVVDNASTDRTPAVLAEFSDRLPLRPVSEPRVGKSHAANRAVREARGELLVWTDDDVLVGRDWLAAYQCAARRHPDAGIFGGPIEPWFEGTPPGWLERAYPEVANAFSALDLGPREIELTLDRYPYGANMAIRRSLHLEVSFDTRIGPHPATRMRGEEMVLVRELLSDGAKGRWVPDARVRHFIPRERQTIEYLRGYYVGSGQVLDYLADPPGRRVFGRPLWLWRQAIEAEAKYRLLRPFAEPATWVKHLRTASVAWGRLLGYAAVETGPEPPEQEARRAASG